MTTMAHPGHLSSLFTAIGAFEGIPTTGASPLLGLSFSVGVGIEGICRSSLRRALFTGRHMGFDVQES
jgi:hypothetical protein